MRKSACLSAALLAAGTLFSTTARAQVRLGLKAGVNNTRLGGRLYDSYAAKFGFHAGVMANVDVTGDGFFSIQPELLYSQKGFAMHSEYVDVFQNSCKAEGTINYSYLDLPVLLKVNARGLIFEAGPQLSYLLRVHNTVKSTVDGTEVSSAYLGGKLEDARRLEWGYAAGLGYQFAAGPLVGLRYHGNFQEFGKDGVRATDFNNARNVAFQLYAGYLLGGQ
ncbi:porin family protein [Hymenobacter persicinus]|uniref:PorT family protein n=1 Tax=Hymenobacter persicinus TaxID=2025506 RepID=A0A4Q5LC46_9BACT|nr:porin family protein [Hymenobacter persicinus]RYU80270.1 PorT family protein [Hymenobacter persicinus]